MPTKRPSLSFAVSPRFDIFYALYARSTAAESKLERSGSRRTKSLSAEFDAVAQRVAPRPIFWPLLADALQNIDGELSFDEMLAALRKLPPADFRVNIVSGIFHDSATVQSVIGGKKTVRQIAGSDAEGGGLLTHFGLRPYDVRSQPARSISALLVNPGAFRDELVTALQLFWESTFREEWSQIEPRLRVDLRWMQELGTDLTLEEVTQELGLPVSFEEGQREVRPRHGPAIAYEEIDRCYVLPSAFNTRRWWARYNTGNGPVNLYFPVVRETGAAAKAAPLKVEAVFRALGDTTRYAIASILARTPTTSAELARTLGVSKPTITHHIQALRSAGLINAGSSGGATRLSLNRQTVAALSDAAVDQLFSGTGDLLLNTTRKRKLPETVEKTS